MHACLIPALTPDWPSEAPGPSAPIVLSSTPLPIVTHSEHPASIKFWATQNVGHFKGDGYKSWICSYKDYCNDFLLPEAAYLKEIGSFLWDKARLWHQDLVFSDWNDWKAKACMHFVGYKPNTCHQLNQCEAGGLPPEAGRHREKDFPNGEEWIGTAKSLAQENNRFLAAFLKENQDAIAQLFHCLIPRWTTLSLIHSGSATFCSTGLDNRFKNGWCLKMTAMVNSPSRRVTRRVLKKVQVVILKRRKHTRPVEVVKAAEKQVVLHDVDSSYLDLGAHFDQLLVPQLPLGGTDPLFAVLFLALSEPREVTETGLQKGNSIIAGSPCGRQKNTWRLS
ncbi:hypothetical protein DSO57_1010908 [Entomophthora muscae]|uniref:Uncharacterized protein n=1 Tax=Entomophthora muscae TaxID=34485 RepID=A0ACC2U534_9FUNG|nr:hypothetical protein DSO57_1010908 [Entomophthora muscae]